MSNEINTLEQITQIRLFTDGSCKFNPGIGGFSYIMILDIKTDKGIQSVDQIRMACQADYTTNNAMELMAIAKGLSDAYEIIRSVYGHTEDPNYRCEVPVTVLSDSAYAVNGATRFINSWIRNRWRTAKGHFTKNMEIWLWINDIIQYLPNVNFHHVDGHRGIRYNEMCDEMAQNAAIGSGKIDFHAQSELDFPFFPTKYIEKAKEIRGGASFSDYNPNPDDMNRISKEEFLSLLQRRAGNG